jgi:hypothetical protein
LASIDVGSAELTSTPGLAGQVCGPAPVRASEASQRVIGPSLPTLAHQEKHSVEMGHVLTLLIADRKVRTNGPLAAKGKGRPG